MSNTTALLSLVVPVFNEEENIPLLTDRICTALNGYTFELIYVDDCSTDATRAAIKKMNNPKVVLVELKKNYGQVGIIGCLNLMANSAQTNRPCIIILCFWGSNYLVLRFWAHDFFRP